MLRNLKRKFASVLLAIALVLTTQSPAMAEHGEQGAAGDPDNAQHYVDRNSMNTNGSNAIAFGTSQLDRSEDMYATLNGSGDVEAYDDNYGANAKWYGLTNCQSGYNYFTGNCDVFRVRFNHYYTSGLSALKWRSLGCHEMGHTAGLGHRRSSNDSDNNSCMREEIWPETLDRHDLNAINASV